MEPSVKLDKVIIIDAMAEVHSLHKLPLMKKITDLKREFVNRVKRVTNSYDEARVIFDRYDVEHNLKETTRNKKAKKTVPRYYDVHDDMLISKVPLKDLLASSKTKQGLSELFGRTLIDEFQNSIQNFFFVTGTTVKTNAPHTIQPSMETHSHEEADSLIPLQSCTRCHK